MSEKPRDGPAAAKRGSRAWPIAQTDIYSLGVVFFRLLTGVLPDRDPGTGDPRRPRAINPNVPANIEAIPIRAMAADPAARYATARQLAADLRAVLDIKRRGLLGRLTGASKRKPSKPPAEPGGREGFWK